MITPPKKTDIDTPHNIITVGFRYLNLLNINIIKLGIKAKKNAKIKVIHIFPESIVDPNTTIASAAPQAEP